MKGLDAWLAGDYGYQADARRDPHDDACVCDACLHREDMT